MPDIEDNKDKIIKQLTEQVIELQQKYDKVIKEKDDEIYNLERQICKNGGKIVPSYLKLRYIVNYCT